MSTQDAVQALKRLGLSNYQAQVFVAVQQLGTGTAQAISEVSDVPRSQVYGAADDLERRGLLEVTESSPKTYRSVSLSAAREQLMARLEQEQARAFENLEALRTDASEQAEEQEVSTLRGRQPIDERIAQLVDTAEHVVVFVAPADRSLTADIASTLRKQAASGVAVTVVTAAQTMADRFEGDPVEVLVMGEDNPADFAGRALMVDEATILLAVSTDEGATEEEAMWTAGTSIGRILAQFMQSGMESGQDRSA